MKPPSNDFWRNACSRASNSNGSATRSRSGFTSAYESWRYFGTLPHLANTKRILAVMCDMRIPLTFTEDDCRLILDIIKDVSATVLT